MDTIDTSISVPLSELDLSKTVYVHIKAIDYSGNSSETNHYEYTFSDKLEVKPKSVSLYKGNSKQLDVVLTSYSYGLSDIKWISSDESVAIVDSKGKITAVGVGKATIKAQVEGTDISDYCEVSVNKRL